MSGKTFNDFVEAMAQSESGGRYDIKNQWGFLGRYQFGMPRLTDLGLCERYGKGFRWKAPLTEVAFLSDHALQDLTFRRHVALLRAGVVAQHSAQLGTTVAGLLVTLSGCIGVCHLLGEGGLREFLHGVDGSDALGTTASTYMKRFTGYVIPDDLVPSPTGVSA